MSFDRNVFINCPFDDDYAPILQAVLFVTVLLRFKPRLATERNDSGETRLERIRELIEDSKYSIHDLSRCQAQRKDEYSNERRSEQWILKATPIFAGYAGRR